MIAKAAERPRPSGEMPSPSSNACPAWKHAGCEPGQERERIHVNCDRPIGSASFCRVGCMSRRCPDLPLPTRLHPPDVPRRSGSRTSGAPPGGGRFNGRRAEGRFPRAGGPRPRGRRHQVLVAHSGSAIVARMETYGPDLGMPHPRPMGDGLFELRIKAAEGIARVFPRRFRPFRRGYSQASLEQ